MDTTNDLQSIASQIDEILEKVKELPEDSLELVGKLKELIEEFHRIPLVKIVRHLKSDPKGKELLLEIVKDPDIYALFLKHGIVRPDLKTQVAKVIELVKPYVHSHGGDVELVDVKDNTVFVRMKGACQGCSQVSVTLKEGILEAVQQVVPQIKEIKLVHDQPVEAFIDLDTKGSWLKLCPIDELEEGEVKFVNSEGVRILLANIEGTVYAYRDSCAHQGLSMEGGEVTTRATIVCPWHAFEYDLRSGECITSPHLQLEPFPTKIEEGWILIRT